MAPQLSISWLKAYLKFKEYFFNNILSLRNILGVRLVKIAQQIVIFNTKCIKIAVSVRSYLLNENIKRWHPILLWVMKTCDYSVHMETYPQSPNVDHSSKNILNYFQLKILDITFIVLYNIMYFYVFFFFLFVWVHLIIKIKSEINLFNIS